MPLRLVVLALAVAGALAASGCGGGNDGDVAYAKQVNAARAGLQRSLAAAPQIATPTSGRAQDERLLAAYQAAAKQARLRLTRVQAPEHLAVLHAHLLAAVRWYEDRLDQARQRLATASGQDALTIRARLADGLAAAARDVDAAIAALNRRMGA